MSKVDGIEILPCDVDQLPCIVMDELGLIFEGFYLLPCLHCKVGREYALLLRGVRLGKHQRRILLKARNHDCQRGFGVIEPENTTRPAVEAFGRARRKLQTRGLIRVENVETEKELPEKDRWGFARYLIGWRIGIKLTPLGQLVRDNVDLTKAIRWSDLLEKLAEKVMKPLPELIFEFNCRLEGERYWTDTVLSRAAISTYDWMKAQGIDYPKLKMERTKSRKCKDW